MIGRFSTLAADRGLNIATVEGRADQKLSAALASRGCPKFVYTFRTASELFLSDLARKVATP
jgi:hypothetical protein